MLDRFPQNIIFTCFPPHTTDHRNYTLTIRELYYALIGAGQVIKGLDMGIDGMKIGGSREVVIPPSLG